MRAERRRQAPGQERRTGQEENGNKLARMADGGGAKRMQLPSREPGTFSRAQSTTGRTHPRGAKHPRRHQADEPVHFAQIWHSWIQLGSVETKWERCWKHLGKDWVLSQMAIFLLLDVGQTSCLCCKTFWRKNMNQACGVQPMSTCSNGPVGARCSRKKLLTHLPF